MLYVSSYIGSINTERETMTTTTTLWGYRHSITKGWNWVAERNCTEGEAGEWLSIFRKDEPDVTFKIAKARPTKSWKGH